MNKLRTNILKPKIYRLCNLKCITQHSFQFMTIFLCKTTGMILKKFLKKILLKIMMHIENKKKYW